MSPKHHSLFTILLLLTLTACHHSPLRGKKILFTTPEGYAERMQKALIETDATPVSLPLIETTIPEKNQELKNLLQNPQQIDWIAFSSRKAIQAFAHFKKKLDIPNQALAKIKFCAIGKDSEYLASHMGIQPAIIPAEPSPAGIVETLSKLEQIQGKHIAVLAPLVTNLTEPNVVPDFIKQLANIGMEVHRINVYHTHPAPINHPQKWLNSICKGEYDVIAFTSTAEAEAFLKLTNGHLIPASQVFACFGPYTAANAKKLGFKIKIVASDFSSFQGFAKEIKKYFSNKEKRVKETRLKGKG